MLLIKILVALIPLAISIFERKKLGILFAAVMAIQSVLIVISLLDENQTKNIAEEQIKSLRKTGSYDSSRIDFLAKTDSMLTDSNKFLMRRSIQILSSENVIRTKVTNIEEALTRKGLKYNPITKEITLINITEINAGKALLNNSSSVVKENIEPVQTKQDGLSEEEKTNIQKQIDQYNTIVSNDRKVLKNVKNRTAIPIIYSQDSKSLDITKAHNKYVVDSNMRETLITAMKKGK